MIDFQLSCLSKKQKYFFQDLEDYLLKEDEKII